MEKPSEGEPCLLSQFDVLALLHETGHALHNLVSETEYGLLHGTGVSTDFVEVHATVLEKLMTIPWVLRRISCHYAHLSLKYEDMWRAVNKCSLDLPERAIPNDLINASLQKSKDFSQSRSYANLASSFFDMAVHNPESHGALEAMNLADTFNQIHRRVRLLHGPEDLGEGFNWGYAYAQSRHLSGSKAAQYYTYLRYVHPSSYDLQLLNKNPAPECMLSPFLRR
jgi:metallopeptidase MepB